MEFETFQSSPFPFQSRVGFLCYFLHCCGNICWFDTYKLLSCWRT